MRCRHCNMENPEGAAFCGGCGRPLEPGYIPGAGNAERKTPVKKSRKGLWIGLACGVVAIAVIVAVLVVVLPQRKEKEMEDLLARGDQYLEELDYEAAEAQYLEAIAVDPKQEEPYLKLAEIYTRQNQPKKAAKILKKGQEQTESPVIEKKYSLYSYVDEVLIPEEGQCQEGEYTCSYKRTMNGISLEAVDSQRGVLTSRIRDFDGDGEEELLVLLLKSGEDLEDTGLWYVSQGEHVNGILMQMYELEQGEVVLKDEFPALCPVLGYGDEESVGIFLQESQGTLYICGSLHQYVYTYADGSAVESFIVTYEDGKFVRKAGQYPVTVGSDFYEVREDALELADLAEEIGLPKDAAKIRETYMAMFEFVDEVDDMLLRITGANDGTRDQDAFFESGGQNPEYLGKVIVSLQLSWEGAESEETAGTEEDKKEETSAREIYEEGQIELAGTLEQVEFPHPNGTVLTATVLKPDEPVDLAVTHENGRKVYENCEQIQIVTVNEIDPSLYGKHVKVTGELGESGMTAYYLDTYVIWRAAVEED